MHVLKYDFEVRDPIFNPIVVYSQKKIFKNNLD